MTERLRFMFSRLMIPGVCLVGLCVVLGFLYRTIPLPPPPPAPVSQPVARPKPAQTYETLKGEYISMVSQGPKKLGEFQGGKYRGSERAVKDELKVFQAWAILINEMPRYPLTEPEKDLVRSVGKRLSSIQRRELPVMRAEFAKSFRQSMLQYRTMAYCAGDRKENLRVIALPGTPQDALDHCMEIFKGETCAQLRFTRIEFTFTLQQTLTAVVKPTKQPPPPDAKLVFWRETIYEPVAWKEEKL